MRINVDDAHLPCSPIDAFRNSSETKEVGRDFFKASKPSDTDDDPELKQSSSDDDFAADFWGCCCGDAIDAMRCDYSPPGGRRRMDGRCSTPLRPAPRGCSPGGTCY